VKHNSKQATTQIANRCLVGPGPPLSDARVAYLQNDYTKENPFFILAATTSEFPF